MSPGPHPALSVLPISSFATRSCRAPSPPYYTPVCHSGPPAVGVGPRKRPAGVPILDVSDLAGIFVFIGAGAGAAMVLRFYKAIRVMFDLCRSCRRDAPQGTAAAPMGLKGVPRCCQS